MKSFRNGNLLVALEKIEYCRADMIVSDSLPNNSNDQQVIPWGKVHANNDWHEFYFTKNTGQLKQTVIRKKNGVIFQQTVKYKEAGYDSDNGEETDEFPWGTINAVNFPLILRLTPCEGDVIIMGRAASPVRLSEDLKLNVSETNNNIMLVRTSNERINIEQRTKP